MQLRAYQTRAVRALHEHLHERPILVSPTGSGKTVMLVALLRELGGRSLWVVHRRELVMQARDHLEAAGLRVGLIMAGEPAVTAPCQVASIQTLIRRDMPETDVIVCDEVHHATSDSYAKLFQVGVPIIGATATPWRLSGESLGDLFGRLIVAARPRELAEVEWLAWPRIFSHPAPSMKGVRKVAGDYSLKQLGEIVNQGELLADIVTTWHLRAKGLRTVCFAVNVAHSKAIVHRFYAAGVPALHIDARTPRIERDAALAALRAGTVRIISNVGIVTEGFDLPALECAILARPTASLCLYLQMVGRVLRPGRAIILDHAGNAVRHGDPLADIEYSLEPGHRAKAELSGLKTCPGCYLLVPVGTLACPECCHAFTASEPVAPPTEADGELTEYKNEFDHMQYYWALYRDEADARGYQIGWAKYRFKDAFKQWPLLISDELIDPKRATMAQKQIIYERLLSTAAERGFQSGWASHQYRRALGCWPRGFVRETRGEAVVAEMQERWEAST